MSRSVTLLVMRGEVRSRCDIEGATARFPDAQLTKWINDGIAELWELINKVQGHAAYYRSSSPFTTVGNVPTYALPADFYKLISVDVQTGSNNFTLTCRPYMESERNRYKNLTVGWIYGQPVYYQLQGQTVAFTPAPSGGYQVTLNYVPTSPILVADGDTFDGISGWEEYPILYASKKAATKDQDWDLKSALEGDLAAMRARIEEMSNERDDQPERPQDVIGAHWGDI
jgi:hypothetical protein